MPTYDPRFWDWWTEDDTGRLYVRRWTGPEMRRIYSSRDWMWARTMNGSLKVARRCAPNSPHERCPVCLRKVHRQEMVGAITGERCCHRCADDLRLLKRAGMVV